jgi:hypothetical protein
MLAAPSSAASQPAPSLVGWLDSLGGDTGHYADENTTGAAPTSRNTLPGRITPLST